MFNLTLEKEKEKKDIFEIKGNGPYPYKLKRS